MAARNTTDARFASLAGAASGFGVRTKREAEDKAIEEERLLGLGLDANAKTETLASFMGRFLDL